MKPTLSCKHYTCLHIVAFVVLYSSSKIECSLSCKRGVDGHCRSLSRLQSRRFCFNIKPISFALGLRKNKLFPDCLLYSIIHHNKVHLNRNLLYTSFAVSGSKPHVSLRCTSFPFLRFPRVVRDSLQRAIKGSHLSAGS